MQGNPDFEETNEGGETNCSEWNIIIWNVLQLVAINNNSVNPHIDANLQHLLIDEEVENIKKENVETKKDLQILKIIN